MKPFFLALLAFLPTQALAFDGVFANAVEQTDVALGMVAIGVTFVLAFAGILIVTATPFLRFQIVFAIMRQAVGINGVPSDRALACLALVLAFGVMSPVLDQAYDVALAPALNGEISFEEAWMLGQAPFREFMLNNTRTIYIEHMLELFDLQNVGRSEIPLTLVWAAFICSEIQTGMMIGFVIYLGMSVIDFSTGAVLMGLGLMMMSPMVLATPLKLLVFVVVDGWFLAVSEISRSFVVL